VFDDIAYLDCLDSLGEYREADTRYAEVLKRFAMTAAQAFDLLGVSPAASTDEIKSAFRSKALKMHPDVNKEDGAEEKFKLLNMAYSFLKDRPSVAEQPRQYSDSAREYVEEPIHNRLREWRRKFEEDKPKIQKRLFNEVIKTDLFQALWNSKELINFYKYKTSRYFKQKNPNMDFKLYRAMYSSFDKFFDNKFYEEYPSASFAPVNFMENLVRAKVAGKTINEAIQELMTNQFDE
jgi:curved DNA-binding protein CbpA